MNANLTRSLTYGAVYPAKSVATNNTASPGFDTKGYIGQLAVNVDIGVKTAGDNDGTITVIIQGSATNSAAAATNISSSTFTVATSNNATANSQIIYDTRAEYRYLFARMVITGTNSPAYPVSVTTVGLSQVQPVQ